MAKAKKNPKRFDKVIAHLDFPTPSFEVIKVEVDIHSNVPPKVVCTCGWATEPETNLMLLGIAAKGHELENPGHVRRHHG